MAKLTLTDPANVVGAETTFLGEIADNNAATETAMENTLSRDGTSPNEMEADLDLNSNDILNAGTISATSVLVNGASVTASTFSWEAAWATSTAYAINQFVENNGNTYICILAHTSGDTDDEPGVGATEATYWNLVAQKGVDGAAGTNGLPGISWQDAWITSTAYTENDAVRSNGSSYIATSDHTSGASTEPGVGGSWATVWDLLAQQGAAGAGSGDMLAANNLSDVASVATSRSNLGLGSLATASTVSDADWSGTDLAVANGGTGSSTASDARTALGLALGTNAQAWDANLDQIAALTPTKGNLLVGNGSAWVALGVGTDTHSLVADSAEASGVKWAAPSAGLWTQVSDTTISSSQAVFDQISLSSYSIVRITIEDLLPVTDNVDLYLRTSTDNGTSFDAGASDYKIATDSIRSSGTESIQSNNSVAQFDLTPYGIGNVSGQEGISGVIHLYGFNGTQYCNMMGNLVGIDNSTRPGHIMATGMRISTTARDAFRILFSSGNIASGRVIVEGKA